MALFASGQNAYKSGLCMATYLDGSRCMSVHAHKYVPYCAQCMEKGDPSLAVVPHPRFGRMLVAKRELPKNYRMGLWGRIEDEMNEEDEEWGFETADGVNINPCPFPTSQVQFSQCPGPHEKVSLKFANPYCYVESKPRKGKDRKEEFGTMVFSTTQIIPKNGQLNMMYAGGPDETDSFFEERGLTRCDVWTEQYPTFLKKGVLPKNLMTAPPAAKSDREKETVLMKVKGNTIDYKKKYNFEGKKDGAETSSMVMASSMKKGAASTMKSVLVSESSRKSTKSISMSSVPQTKKERKIKSIFMKKMMSKFPKKSGVKKDFSKAKK